MSILVGPCYVYYSSGPESTDRGKGKQEDETKAKRALVTLCEILKKKVWLGDKHDRVAIAICEACFHASSWRFI
ncbi:unnamed protein product [Brassica rapa]|uniref:Uncharacterized protein n=1 Tax=Brassica campestris TaxID=3711 RepID=A0A8D9DAL3_BRACM|nr:unnamed protein product [Brassica rapa]